MPRRSWDLGGQISPVGLRKKGQMGDRHFISSSPDRGALLMTSLFDPITFGAINAPNRILMAPLTRGRATRSHVPTPLMGQYYTQRASAGLIISEATGISQQGLGWPAAPGLLSEEQVAS